MLLDEDKNKLEDLFVKTKELLNYSFVIVDSLDKIKKVAVESWFKQTANLSNAIWIGNGINDQYTINIIGKIPELRMEIPEGFAFYIKVGRPIYFKYLSHY